MDMIHGMFLFVFVSDSLFRRPLSLGTKYFRPSQDVELLRPRTREVVAKPSLTTSMRVYYFSELLLKYCIISAWESVLLRLSIVCKLPMWRSSEVTSSILPATTADFSKHWPSPTAAKICCHFSGCWLKNMCCIMVSSLLLPTNSFSCLRIVKASYPPPRLFSDFLSSTSVQLNVSLFTSWKGSMDCSFRTISLAYFEVFASNNRTAWVNFSFWDVMLLELFTWLVYPITWMTLPQLTPTLRNKHILQIQQIPTSS